MAIDIDPALVNWSDAGPLAGRRLVILLHGYSGNEHSMDAVTAALGADFVTAAPRGPRESGGALPGGFAWYDVDERFVPLPGLAEEVTAGLHAWLDAVIAERGEPSAIVLVGFSQGAAFSLYLLRGTPERFAAVVTLAGFWLPGVVDGEERLAALRPPIFWGRSEADPAIPSANVETTRAALETFAPGSEHVYPGATHVVLPEMVTDLAAFLREHFG